MAGRADRRGGAAKRAERIRELQRRTLNAMRSSAPTHVIAARFRDTQVDDEIANEAIDLALRFGEAQLAVGVSASATTATILRIAAAYGLTSCQVEVTFTSITLSVARPTETGGVRPVTAVRLVKIRMADFNRLAELDELAESIHEISAAKALERLDEILSEPHPYRRWIVTFALAGMAAAIAFLMAGEIAASVIAGVTTGLIDRTLRRLNRWGLPLFFQQVAGAGLATLIAVGVSYLPQAGVEALRPSLTVASGVTVLLAGLAFVGSAEDAIAGFYLTASARAFEVILLTAGIVTGIGVVLALSRPIGTLDTKTVTAAPLLIQLAMAGAIAASFAVASYARLSAVPVVAATAIATYAIFYALRSLDVEVAMASGLAAVALGIAADVLGSRAGIAPLVLTTCGITPLLPGLAIYHGLSTAIEGSTVEGAQVLLQAASVALALAAGVALGSFLGTPWRTGYDRYDRRVRRKARSPRD